MTLKPFQTPAPRPEAVDVPLHRLEAGMEALVARQRNCQTLADAAKHTSSPSTRIAYAHDAWLLSHPKACAIDDDYPGWAEHIAHLIEANQQPGRAS